MNGYWITPKLFHCRTPGEQDRAVNVVCAHYGRPAETAAYQGTLFEGGLFLHRVRLGQKILLVPMPPGTQAHAENRRGEAGEEHDEKARPLKVTGPFLQIPRWWFIERRGEAIALERDPRTGRWGHFAVASVNGSLYADFGRPVGFPSGP